MELLIDRLDDSPLPLDFEVAADWVAERFGPAQAGFALESPLRVSLRAGRMGAKVHLQGELRGKLALSCGRCLAGYAAPLRESFRLVLEPAGARTPQDPEGAEGLAAEGLYLCDDLEMGWFRGNRVRLDRFVAELLALGQPLQPLCSKDCVGLCAVCGGDRNARRCDCPAPQRPSPFAVLGAYAAGDGPGARAAANGAGGKA